MKITVSYISSKYDTKTTIRLINKSCADGLHVDLMDGLYAGHKNYDIDELPSLLKDNTLPMDIHLMIENPSKIIDKLLALNPDCIYIHPKTEGALLSLLSEIKLHEVKCGIAINPEEKIDEYKYYYPYIDRILLMGVHPGAGGQKYIPETTQKLHELLKYKEEYNFEIYIDGGVNDSTIGELKSADGVVSGSYICNSDDFQKKIDSLKI